MFNVKAVAMTAAGAFVLSFLLSLLSGTSFPTLLLRPLLFAAIFFVIAGFISVLVRRFLPDLMEANAGAADDPSQLLSPGARVNIMESDDAPRTSMPDFAQADAAAAALADDDEGGLDDISGFVNEDPKVSELPPLVENVEPAQGEFKPQDAPAERLTVKTPIDATADNNYTGSGRLEVLPDLDSLAGAFKSSDDDDDGGGSTDYSADYPAPGYGQARKAGAQGQKMEGDFSPKDIAAGLRTILSKEG